MLSINQLKDMKKNNEKISMITAYDYPSAKQVEAAGTDIILVGDSLGMVVLGYDSTIDVTIDDMIHHGQAVRRGAKDTFVLVDMPFMSYHTSVEESVKNAKEIFQKTKANALKLEGNSPIIKETIKRLAIGGIPVVGHLGLTPQTVNMLGGYKLQANTKEDIEQLIKDAKELEEAGIVGLVLECIPRQVGKHITEKLNIPTIGIGAGAETDGQVLVYHDILQYGPHSFPKFVKNYGDFNNHGVDALKKYVQEVKDLKFPSIDETYTLKDESFLKE